MAVSLSLENEQFQREIESSDYPTALFNYMVRSTVRFAPIWASSLEPLIVFAIADLLDPPGRAIDLVFASAEKMIAAPPPEELQEAGALLRDHAKLAKECPKKMALALHVSNGDKVRVFQELIDPYCGCCRKLASLTCSRCKREKYCSATCQEREWPIHKMNCSKRGINKKGTI